MRSLYGMALALQGSSWWSGAGIFVLALVICCLVMMFTMRRGMGGKSGNHQDMDKQSKKNEGEQPGTKNP